MSTEASSAEATPDTAPEPPAAEVGAVGPEAAASDKEQGAGPATDGRRIAGTIRVASHVAVWAAVLVPAVRELTLGWRPFGDNAAIASRAYAVFSSHAPLTGLASGASFRTGHLFYDPGPLSFFLLAVPERVDASQGLFWGAALFAGVALSLAVEGAWVAGRALGAALAAFIALDMLWLTPQVFENVAWNAYFPLPFLVTAVAATVAVARGRTSWWPVAVVTASVAAQSHLFFVLPALALALVGLAFGLLGARSRRRLGWLWTGLVLGLLCWLAPIVQQLADRNGNLAALLHAHQGQTLGMDGGLRELSLAASPHPLWLVHLPTNFVPLLRLEEAHSSWYGGLVLGLLVVAAVGAFATGRRTLGSLCVVTFAFALTVVVSFAIFPAKNFISVGYLIDVLWPLSVLLWVVAVWVLATLTRFVLAQYRKGWLERGTSWAPSLSPVAGLLALVVLALVAVVGLRPVAAHPVLVDWSPADIRIVSSAATAVERAVRPGPVSIVVTSDNFYIGTWASEGLAYRLQSDGWQPGTSGDAARYSGLTLPPGTAAPRFHLTIERGRLVSLTETA